MGTYVCTYTYMYIHICIYICICTHICCGPKTSSSIYDMLYHQIGSTSFHDVTSFHDMSWVWTHPHILYDLLSHDVHVV